MSCGSEAEARRDSKEQEEEGREQGQPVGLCTGNSGHSSSCSLCEMPWSDGMFITQHKEHLQKMAGLGCQ